METLQNFPLLSPILSDGDLEVLDYISSIVVDKTLSHATIRFIFEENPYFHNSEISKHYTINEFDIYVTCKASKINWKVKHLLHLIGVL